MPNFNNSFYILWRKGTVDDPYVNKTETLKIVNNIVVLSEIPDKFQHVSVSGYFEVYKNDTNTLVSDKFYTDYQNGILTFNQSENGKTVTVSYLGKGVILYPASRIYVSSENTTNPIESLQDIVDSSAGAIQAMHELEQMANRVDVVVAESEIATENANIATNNANSAANNLGIVISDAQTATSNANSAANSASIATDNANTATTQANTARDAANTATTQANMARDTANIATTNANTASDNANTAATNANNAATNANGVASSLTHKGEYGSTTPYVPRNIVNYNGSSYMNIVASTGVVPTNTTNWKVVSQAGIVTAVESANSDITIDSSIPARPKIGLNVGSGGNQIVKRNESGYIVDMSSNTVNVKWLGAKGDGTTDDLVAINNAISMAVSLGEGASVYFPPGIGYAVSSTVIFDARLNVIMDAPIIYTGTAYTPCIVVGSTGTYPELRTYKLHADRRTRSDWTSEEDIGIKLMNLTTCNIRIVSSSNFTIGVQCIGSSDGFVYNHMEIGELINNKVAIDLTNELGGWCNENIFVGGRFSNYSNVGPGLFRCGIRITSKDGTYLNNNNNLFTKPSFELNDTYSTPNEALPILIEHGHFNEFISCRDEGNTRPFIRVMNDSSSNSVKIGYGVFDEQTVDEQSTFPSTVVSARRHEIRNSVGNTIFISGPLHKKASYYNASDVHIANVHIASASNSSVFKALPGITIADKYIDLGPRGIGVFVDTSKVKHFIVRRDVEVSNPGRIAVRCYDSNGVILSDTGPGHPYVKSLSETNPYFSSNYGGTYFQGSDDTQDFYFTVNNDVKTIAVIIGEGSAPCRIRSFSIEALTIIIPTDIGLNAAVWAGYEEGVVGASLASTSPVNGSYIRGKVVYNAEPDAGEFVGWTCVRSGIAAPAWTASRVVAIGNYAVPTTDTGKVYRCSVAGTTGTTQPTWPTIAGGTIVDGTVTWTYDGDIAALFKGFGAIQV